MGWETEWEQRTTTAVRDCFFDSVLATEGVLHGLRVERVAGSGISLSMSSCRSQPQPVVSQESEVAQLGARRAGDGGDCSGG